MSDTDAGRFLGELYQLESVQPSRRIIVTRIDFKEPIVLLMTSRGTVSLGVESSRRQIFDGLTHADQPLQPPSPRSADVIHDEDVPSLWAELHFDLSRDFGLVTTGALKSYQSVSLIGNTVTVEAASGGATRSLKVALRPGELQTALSMEVARLFSEVPPGAGDDADRAPE